MDFSDTINNIVLYLQNNTVVALGLAFVSLLLLWRKTKLFVTILVVTVLLLVIMSLISNLANIGSSYKRDMARERTLP